MKQSFPKQIDPGDDMDVASVVWAGSKEPVDFWDDGYGPLWVSRNCLSIDGVVRAQSWEDAYQCAIDELLPDYDYNAEDFDEDGNPPEGVGWRDGGVPINPKLNAPMYQKDLNGQAIVPLTPELAEDLGIIVTLVAR